MRTKSKSAGGGPPRDPVHYLVDVVHGRVPSPVRTQLIRDTMAMIVSRQDLDAYVMQLDPQRLADEVGEFDEAAIAAIIENGIDHLPNDQIARLLTDPVALMAIHAFILRIKPDKWIDALAAHFAQTGFSEFQKRIRKPAPRRILEAKQHSR